MLQLDCKSIVTIETVCIDELQDNEKLLILHKRMMEI